MISLQSVIRYPSDAEAKRLILEVGRRMYEKNFVAANDGNISCRVSEDTLWTTPTGVSKGFMTEDMLVKMRLDGTVLQQGKAGPSSEVKMHVRVYLENPDAQAVCHAHPPVSTSFAIAGAMETDLFVQELVEKLEESGHLDDTVLVFYPDHMNFYLQDDALEMELRGVDNSNLLLKTDFFIWSSDLPAAQVEKVTSSLDVLPTLANLFDLDTAGAFLVGHDGLGDQGGYVFFNDGSWYDGETYWDSESREEGDPVRTAEINRVRSLASKVLAGNYYGSGFGEALAKAN